jgi:hypothetical protein
MNTVMSRRSFSKMALLKSDDKLPLNAEHRRVDDRSKRANMNDRGANRN